MATAYEILGLPVDASFRDIKIAHNKKSISEHPDKSSLPDADARFKAIQEAYECLKDPITRMNYDISQGILPPQKIEVIQFLQKLYNEADTLIKSLPEVDPQDPKYLEASDRNDLLTRYRNDVEAAMKDVYNQKAPYKLYEPLQELMQKAKATAENPLIAEHPKSCNFFTKVLHAIQNFLSILFPRLKSAEHDSPNKKILSHFHQIDVKSKQHHAEQPEEPPTHPQFKPHKN